MSLITYLNLDAIKDASIEGIKLKDGAVSASKIDSSVASKKYVDDTIASAISASDAMVFKGTIGTGGTSESLPSTAIVGDTYKVIALTTIPGASSYTGVEETAKVGDLIVAISAEPKWIVVPSGDEAIDALVQPITWSDLKAKRDAGSLIPGMQYRITDYQCTTSQANTRSAGHQFDIIVTADDESTLNEVARAVKHDGDTYFANSDLSAWKLWYCLDNDFSRFGWAMIGELIDTIKPTNGNASGTYTYNVPISKIAFNDTIYNLEIGVKTTINSGPPTYVTKIDDYTLVVEDKYNFVNSGGGISVYAVSQICQGVIYRMIDEFNNDCPYDFKNIQFKHPNDTTAYPYYYYTFASFGAENNYDCSLSKYCYSNIIKECINKNKRVLNNIIFIGDQCYCNFFEKDCYNNTFEQQCSYNYLGYNCYNNTFKYGSNYNTLGIRCFNNTIHNSNNSFGNYCYNNTIRGSNNLLGKSCNINTIYGDVNSFGDSCDDNIINGNNNSFGDSCKHIKFESNYYKNNHFEDNCQYILFKGTETASSSAQVQNYNFTRGLQGTSDEYLTVGGIRNRAYETKVAKNSNGELKIYCEADLIA